MRFKLITFLIFFVGVLFSLPQQSNAASFLHQYVDSSSFTALSSGTGFDQRLGTGLGGFMTDLSVKVSFAAAAGSGDYSIGLSSCDATYTSCTVVWNSNTQGLNFTVPAGGLGASIVTVTATSSIPIIASNYYKINVGFRTGTQHTITIYGSSSNVYTGGVCVDNAGGSISPVVDCYFDVGGGTTAFDSSYVTNLSPVTGSTTASTLVNFSFDYHNVTSDALTGYLINVTDVTVGQNFSLQGSVSSGDATISRTSQLTSGHRYTWLACLINASDSICAPISQTFSVVVPLASTTQNPIYTSTSTISYDTSGNVIGTTTSFSTTGVLPNFLDTVLREKFPFSYMYDGIQLIYELFSGDSSTNSGYHYQNGPASTTIQIFDTEAIAAQSSVIEIKKVLGYAIYVMTGLGLVAMIMSSV